MSGHRPPARAALALALLLSLAASARAAEPATPGVPGIPGTSRTSVLPNGLRLVLVPDPDAAAVDVSVWYDAGLRAEAAGQQGIAHLFEHLMFDGSAHVPRRGHRARIEALGGNAGAVTTADGVCFFETVPASGLDTALELEADRMTGLIIDTARIDGERMAIRYERMQPSLNSPYQVGLRLVTELAYGTHPYHSPAMGSDADLARLTLKDALAWYRARYGPRRAVLTIVGRFDPDEAMTQVTRHFGALRGGDPAQAPPRPAAATAERRRWVRAALPFPLLVLGWTGPGGTDPDGPALTILAMLLAHGDDSRLAARLIDDQKTCFFLDSDIDARRDASLFTLVAGLQPGADSAAVERMMNQEVERVASQPPTDDEMTRARRQVENSILFGWQSSRGRAQAIGSAVAMGGTPADPERQLERLRGCTAADVQHAAARWLTAPRRSVVWLAPRTDDSPAPTGGAR
jgi:zinc protease